MCEGSCEVTADEHSQSKASVMREIIADEDSGITSRTKQAVLSGAIKFAPCPACDGTGTVPGEATLCGNCAAVLATSSSVHSHFGLSVCGICYDALLGPSSP